MLELKSKFVSYTQITKELSQLRDNYERASKEADYNLFLLEELSALSLKNNELEELEEELKLLSNAEQIKQQLSFIIEAMASADQPLVQQAKQLNIKLSALSKYHNDIGVLSERLGSAVIEFQDIADELEAIESKLNLT